jgi:epoxyqueuosine reductase
MESSQDALTRDLNREALGLGFQSVGVCPAASPPGLDRFRQWLDAGYAGQMHYLADRADAYTHPRHVMDGVRSVVMLSVNYHTRPPRDARPGTGRVSRYAWGSADYHDVIRDRLGRLADWLRQRVPGSQTRGVVDTAPLLEREFAQLAGLGWIGKNTLLLTKDSGSWLFLAALLTDVELRYDEPHHTDHCGRCRACLDACPTDAFVQPYVLDATRCISYLTIELRDSVPGDLRGDMGPWIFGCDVCQDVCPWNHRAPVSPRPEFQPDPRMDPIDLPTLLEMDDRAFRERFRKTPLWRARRRGLLRNAAIALGNRPTSRGMGALCRGLRDNEPLVRAACAWALGRYDDPAAATALRSRLAEEPDADVRREIAAAVTRHDSVEP